MIYLAAILFTALMYVVPGFWLLDMAARRFDLLALPVPIRFWLLSSAVFAVSLITVTLGRLAFVEYNGQRGSKSIRPFLDARGCRWLTIAGLILIGYSYMYMTARWAMPYQFAPLYVSLLAGFLDLRRRPAIVLPEEALPEIRFNPLTLEPTPQLDSQAVRFEWDAPVHDIGSEMNRFLVELVISHDEIQRAVAMASEPIETPEDYGRYIRSGPSESLREMARKLREETLTRKFTPLQEIDLVVRLVRSIPYHPDPATGDGVDFPKYPVLTLAEQGGDCEDHAILAAAILWQLGHPVGLFYLRLEDGAHMGLAYRSDGFQGNFSKPGPDRCIYSYIETTASGAGLGEMPDIFLENLWNAMVILPK